MTKNRRTKNSHLWGKRGGFYFSLNLTTLKKFFLRPFCKQKGRFAQSAIEYFVIFTAVLALTLLSTSFFFPRVKTIVTNFYNKTASEITEEDRGNFQVLFCRSPHYTAAECPTDPYTVVNINVKESGGCYTGGGREFKSDRCTLACWNYYTSLLGGTYVDGPEHVATSSEWCKRLCLCVPPGMYTICWKLRSGEEDLKCFTFVAGEG